MSNEKNYRIIENNILTNQLYWVAGALKEMTLTKAVDDQESLLAFCARMTLPESDEWMAKSVLKYVFTDAANGEMQNDPFIDIGAGQTMHWMDWIAQSEDLWNLLTEQGVASNIHADTILKLLEHTYANKALGVSGLVNRLTFHGVAFDHLLQVLQASSTNIFERAQFYSKTLGWNSSFALKQLHSQGIDLLALYPADGINDGFVRTFLQIVNPDGANEVQISLPAALCAIMTPALVVDMVALLDNPGATVLKVGDKEYGLLEVIGMLGWGTTFASLRNHTQALVNAHEARSAADEIRALMKPHE